MKLLHPDARLKEVIEAVNLLIESLDVEESITETPVEAPAPVVTPQPETEIPVHTVEYPVQSPGEADPYSMSIQGQHVRDNATGIRYSIDEAPESAKAYLKAVGKL